MQLLSYAMDINTTCKCHGLLQNLIIIIITITIINWNSRVVRISVDHYDAVGVGWKIWESSLIMSRQASPPPTNLLLFFDSLSALTKTTQTYIRWVCENQRRFSNKRVLEVGSGVGLLGIVAAPYCKEIVLSDCVHKVG